MGQKFGVRGTGADWREKNRAVLAFSGAHRAPPHSGLLGEQCSKNSAGRAPLDVPIQSTQVFRPSERREVGGRARVPKGNAGKLVAAFSAVGY